MQNGVISASKNPTIDDGRVVDISTEIALDMCYFFDDGVKEEKDIPEYKVTDFLKRSLSSTRSKEEELRNAVFTDLLDNHDIRFPQSSLPKVNVSKKGLHFFLRGPFKPKTKRYVESDLASILEQYGRDRGQELSSLRRIVRGLPVATTSKPGLVSLDGSGETEQVRFGEFKNHENYTIESARTHCIMYLLGLLYWLRGEMGMPVESVYGFFFCGCRCADQGNKMYTVGLIQLSAPRFLGDDMKTVRLERSAETSNLYPIRLLIHFLKTGKRWEVAKRPNLETDRRIPSVFTLPTNLWDDTVDRRLVLHGTLSIVFNLSAKGLKDLIVNGDSCHFRFPERDKYWNQIREYVSSLGGTANETNTDARYFLKVRARDTSAQSHPMGAMVDAWDLLVEDRDQKKICSLIKETYPLVPYANERIGVVLMNDRGARLRDVAESEDGIGISILKEFKEVIETAMFLSKRLPHGDVLPHNLVYDQSSDEMTLIDLDEGVRMPKVEGMADHLLRRKNEFKLDNNDWYIATMYPNALRASAENYTKVQLTASFLYLMEEIKDPFSEVLVAYDAIFQQAKELGAKLCTLDMEGSSLQRNAESKDEVIAMVDSVYQMMIAIVNNATDDS